MTATRPSSWSLAENGNRLLIYPNMMQRPNSCIGCPLHETSVPGFCPDNIPAGAKYLLIAEAPGTNEIAQAEPMVGKAGFVLKEWLLKSVSELRLASERGEVGLANVLRCLPKEVAGRPYPTGETKRLAEQHCRQYDHIPESVHTVVLQGEHSQRLFFGPEMEAEDASDRQLGHEVKGVLGRVGKVMERDGKRWVFTIHPAFVLRQPSMVEHAQQALNIAVNAAVVVEPNYMPWDQAVGEL